MSSERHKTVKDVWAWLNGWGAKKAPAEPELPRGVANDPLDRLVTLEIRGPGESSVRGKGYRPGDIYLVAVLLSDFMRVENTWDVCSVDVVWRQRKGMWIEHRGEPMPAGMVLKDLEERKRRGVSVSVSGGAGEKVSTLRRYYSENGDIEDFGYANERLWSAVVRKRNQAEQEREQREAEAEAAVLLEADENMRAILWDEISNH